MGKFVNHSISTSLQGFLKPKALPNVSDLVFMQNSDRCDIKTRTPFLFTEKKYPNPFCLNHNLFSDKNWQLIIFTCHMCHKWH